MKKLISFLGIMMMAMFLINPVSAQEKKKNYEEVQIQTSAVCGDCEQRIESNIAYEKGVKKVELDDSTKIVTIGFDPRKTDAGKLRTAISKIGYDADDVAADKEAHDKLPACCQKGNAPH
ncbi:MAG: cation transporter [Bacteroidales bacterium]|jgi:copper chaperone CopZ|nr:cation transporter [Bacteroidales bacterium]